MHPTLSTQIEAQTKMVRRRVRRERMAELATGLIAAAAEQKAEAAFCFDPE
jgi:hypothetical protein